MRAPVKGLDEGKCLEASKLTTPVLEARLRGVRPEP